MAESVEPVSSDETWTLVDLAALAELESSGLIDVGEIVRSNGQAVAIVFMRINLQGRAYLAELKKVNSDSLNYSTKKDTQWDKKPIGNVTILVIAGVIVFVITTILIHYLPKWFHQ